MATILTKRSNTASSVPVAGDLTNSTSGAELAVNTADKRLFVKDSGGTVQELGTNPSTFSLPNGTANGVAYLNGSKVLTTGSALTFDGTVFKAGLIRTSGASSGIQIDRRDTSASAYTLYSSAGNLQFYNGTSDVAVLDSSGNLGLGVTPSAWGSGQKALDVNGAGIMGAGVNAYYASNAYFNAGWKYKTSSTVALYSQEDGVHKWNTAPSGTAGNAISFTQALTLDASGNLLLGTTTANGGISSAAPRLVVVPPNSSSHGMVLKSEGSTYDAGLIWNAGTSGNNHFFEFGTEGTYTSRGSITYNRSGGLVAYNVTSDYRAKDIIGPVVNSGELIDSVPVYMGKMKGATQERPMFIAHETPPYAHTGEKDAVDKDGNPVYQQMDSSSLVPVMWAELQSLRKRIAELEAR